MENNQRWKKFVTKVPKFSNARTEFLWKIDSLLFRYEKGAIPETRTRMIKLLTEVSKSGGEGLSKEEFNKVAFRLGYGVDPASTTELFFRVKPATLVYLPSSLYGEDRIHITKQGKKFLTLFEK